MPIATSVFLDVLRFSAACIVFLSHVTSREFNAIWPWVRWGHEAVVVFFVISGYVIAYVISNREQNPKEYAAARFGRLYSVVIPALLLTAIIDATGRSASAELYKNIPNDYWALRLLINALFLQQSWNLTVIPLSNGPFWSLGFEFWYYALFGAAVLYKGALRVGLIVFFSLCAGPRILAYFPVWLLGVAAFRLQRSWHLSTVQTRTLLFSCIGGLLAILIFGNPLKDSLAPLLVGGFSDNFISVGNFRLFLGDIPKLPADMLLAIFIALLIVSIRGSDSIAKSWRRPVAIIQYFAGATFTLYLFHVPLLYFITATLQPDKYSALDTGFVGLLVFVLCLLLSYLGERKVAIYRRFFLKLFARQKFWNTFRV